jgi:protein-disulfide isomerase
VNRDCFANARMLGAFLLGLAALTLALATSTAGQTKVAAAALAPSKAMGSKSAPITIEVFSDFQCPACKQTFQQTLRPLMDDYVAAGKVYLVHRDFPLPMHNHSREAARWANAAAQVGKFEPVEEALYTKQETWAANGNIDTIVAAVLTPAEMKKVRQLMQGSGPLDAAIDKDVELGKSRRVSQTPSLFVTHGGETVPLPPGGVSYPILKQYLDYLLK